MPTQPPTTRPISGKPVRTKVARPEGIQHLTGTQGRPFTPQIACGTHKAGIFGYFESRLPSGLQLAHAQNSVPKITAPSPAISIGCAAGCPKSNAAACGSIRRQSEVGWQQRGSGVEP